PRLHTITPTSNVPPARHNALIQITADYRLKKTTNTRMETAERHGVQVVSGNDWPSVSQPIWDFYSRHVQKRAKQVGAPPVWQMDDEYPTIERFEDYVSLRHIKRTITPWNSDEAALYTLRRLRNEVILVCVLKWGNQIGNSKQLAQFTKACIPVVPTDRAGAVSERHHQSVISALKSQWGCLLTGMEISWRLWANHICSKKDGDEEAMIQQPPPDFIVRQFSAVSSSAQETIIRLQENVSFAKDIVNSMIEEIASLVAEHRVFGARLHAIEAMLQTNKKICESVAANLRVNSEDRDVLIALRHMPNTEEDPDHA
ncbi:unnamed protein product, partial [Aphanomyces euteiches]